LIAASHSQSALYLKQKKAEWLRENPVETL